MTDEMLDRLGYFLDAWMLPSLDRQYFIETVISEMRAGARSVPLAAAWSQDGNEHMFNLNVN